MGTDWLAVRERLQKFELKNEKSTLIFLLTNKAKKGLVQLHFFGIEIV